jgi:septum formation protein
VDLTRRAPLVLASSSPRRLDLLRQAGVEPDLVVSPDIDETVAARELPRAYGLRMAQAKAQAVHARPDAAGAFVLAADTVVACGRRILPKAQTRAEARSCLELLSGRRHRVYGGLTVVDPEGRPATKLVMTIVKMKPLTVGEIELYLASGEWQGKAGGYAIQGLAARFVPMINGSYTNVVGLPLLEALQLLEGRGWRSR